MNLININWDSQADRLRGADIDNAAGTRDHDIESQGYSAVCIGFFDGCHVGHRALINTLLYAAAEANLSPCILTFDRLPPHNNAVSTYEDSVPGSDMGRKVRERRMHEGGTFLLQSAADRYRHLTDCGADRVYVQQFSTEFSRLSPEDYLEKVLYRDLRVRLIVVGYDFRFGADSAGRVAHLQRWGEELGVRVIVIPPVRINGATVHSSLIRQALLAGHIEEVNRYLGHHFSIRGEVIRGSARGRTTGHPTANILCPPEQIWPPFGVYVTLTEVDGRYYPSISNFGVRPTVDDPTTEPILESLIFDRELDLYGKEITVHLLSFIRPEERFESYMTMVAQIYQDIEHAEAYLRNTDTALPCYSAAGTEVRVIRAERFNTVSLYWEFYFRKTENLCSAVPVIARILTAASKAYPTKPLLAARLADLYGATWTADAGSFGDLGRLVFHASAVGHVDAGINPIDELLELVLACLTEPLTDESGHFDAALVASEINNQLDLLKAVEDNPHSWAGRRFIDNLTVGHTAHGLSSRGNSEQLQTLTPAELSEIWHELLHKAPLRVRWIGRIRPAGIDRTIEALQELRPYRSHRAEERGDAETDAAPMPVPGRLPSPMPLSPLEPVVEERQAQQSSLRLAYKLPYSYVSPERHVLTLLNAMLGGGADSMLFAKIREELGLAYSVRSELNHGLGVLTVSAAVHPGSEDVAEAAINETIARLAAGDFSASLFNNMRKQLYNSLISLRDSLSGTLSYDVAACLSRQSESPADLAAKIRQIQPHEIAETAAGLVPILSYRLQPNRE
ncbi:MAG: riboflavin biosynthesis protein RibF [Clostridiaceae bacterium]|nr:riboflavin biosynthesis protein RibF [Clostridiaceae bacterium]